MREADKLPPVANKMSLPPEGIEELLAGFQTDEEKANFLDNEVSDQDYENWFQWKKAKGQATETPADEAPPLNDATQIAAKTGQLRLNRTPFSAANAMVAEGNADMVNPQQLAQMQSMAAAAEAAQGRPSQEPPKVEGPGILGGNFGMGLRAGVQGATALPALPLNLMTSLMPYGGDGDVVGQIMDAAGAKRPQSRNERIMSDIISGMSGSGAVMAGGKALGRLGYKTAAEKFAAAPVAQLIGGGTGGLAAGTVREEGGSQGEQLIAAILAGQIPSANSAMLKQAFTRGVDKDTMAATMDNFATAGETPTLGQLTGGGKTQATEAFLAQLFSSSPIIKNKLAKQEEAIIGANQKVADSLAPIDAATGQPVQMSNAELGNLIEDTWNNSGKKAISNTRTAFGQRLADEVSPRSGVEMPNLTSIIDELTFIDPGAKNLSQNKIFNPDLPAFQELGKDLKKDLAANLRKQLADGVDPMVAKEALPFEAVRKLKTRLGAQMDNSVFGAQNVSQADQRRLFGGIAEDIKAFIKDQGVDAEQAFNEWNKWEVDYHREVSALRSVLDKNGGPEKVYRAAFAGANEGPTIISAVYNNLDQGARDALTSAWLAKAAKTGSKTDPDETNLGQLFGNYRNLSDEAKEIMFTPEVRKQLDKLNSAAKTVLKSEKDFGMKASGRDGTLGIQAPLYATTGLVSGLGGLSQSGGDSATALFSVLAGLATTTMGSAALAKYMTNPKTVKWMAANSNISPSALPTAINLLAQEARKSQDPDMIEFARLMEEASQDNGDN